ncbi:MAG TPA: hypothetical protein VGF33_09725 [Caulobacteraceae bacterium]
MRSVFGSRPSWWGPRTATAQSNSAGRVAGDDRPVEQAISRAEIDAAYNKGRWDEARSHRGSPLFSFLILLVVASAAAMFYLAAQNGSFASGGAAVDNRLSQASQTVQAPFKRAANQAGDALERAGHNLKQDAGDQPANQ